MNILVSGCSFTQWPEEPGSPNNICWPAYLQKMNPDWIIDNRAEPGAGNQYIANSIVQSICSKPDFYDLVLVMWTGVSRLDFLTDLTNKDWEPLFIDYNFYRRIDNCPNDLGYIFSGGQMGIWYQNKVGHRLFNELYKVSGDRSLAYTNLIEMVKTQHYLRAKNIPYLFMSYVNYWVDTQDYISPNGDFGVMGIPELRPLIDDIDFSRWLFRNEQRECIYDMAKENKDYHGDEFHPGPNTHRLWAAMVSRRLKEMT